MEQPRGEVPSLSPSLEEISDKVIMTRWPMLLVTVVI
jgi:hypothetical protein